MNLPSCRFLSRAWPVIGLDRPAVASASIMGLRNGHGKHARCAWRQKFLSKRFFLRKEAKTFDS
jgi:hypothetical protein